MTIVNRVLIVGSPRSGTSLLQSLVGGHPTIKSFPETHIFYNLYRNKLHKLFKITPTHSYKELNKIIEELTNKSLDPGYTKWNLITHSKFINAAFELLDNVTLSHNKSVWSEKTPLHLHCIKQLEAVNPNLLFIHIIREGKNVVKSSYSLAKRYPKSSWGKHATLEYWINRWNQDLEISSHFMSKSNHMMITYNDLIDNTYQTLNNIFDFLTISKVPLDKLDYKSSARDAKFLDQPWHSNLNQEIGVKKSELELLTTNENLIIEKKISFDLYNKIVKEIEHR